MQFLEEGFFNQDTLVVARALLGAYLVRILDGQRLVGRIVECEAYIGEADSACYARHGRTPRTELLYGPPGRAFVGFTYGLHWMFNVVTEPPGWPAAVLIRAVEPVEGIETMWVQRRARGAPRRIFDLTSGPAKLAQALAIDARLNGVVLDTDGPLWLEPGAPRPEDAIRRGPRVGIDYATPADRAAPWRFWLHDSPFVSRPSTKCS